jgi:nucleotide-binding universal stress UspA family protein
MKDFHVMMPVAGFVKVTKRFDSLLNFLHERRATVHLTCRINTPLTIYDDSERLKSQQKQMHKMGIMLKHEMLDRIAQKFQSKYPALTFQYHVEDKSLNETVASLENAFDIQLLIVDQEQLIESSEDGDLGEFHHLLASTNIPIWSIGSHTDIKGETVVALDLPAHNLQHEQLNRLMVRTAHHLAIDFNNRVCLSHCWQLSTQEFMRRWLKLTDIDVARFARVEKQQRESHLIEYIEQTNAQEAEFKISIVEGDAKHVLPTLCRNQQTRLLIIGHDQNPYGSMGKTTVNILMKATCDTLILPYAPFAQSNFLDFIAFGANKKAAKKEEKLLPSYYQTREDRNSFWLNKGG